MRDTPITLINGFQMLISSRLGGGLWVAVVDAAGDAIPLTDDGEPEVPVFDAAALAELIAEVTERIR
jgi:hypothetical protein